MMLLKDALGLQNRTRNALLRGQHLFDGHLDPVDTVEKLAGSTMRELLCLKGFGKKSLLDCEWFLREHGFNGESSVLLSLFDEWDNREWST